MPENRDPHVPGPPPGPHPAPSLARPEPRPEPRREPRPGRISVPGLAGLVTAGPVMFVVCTVLLWGIGGTCGLGGPDDSSPHLVCRAAGQRFVTVGPLVAWGFGLLVALAGPRLLPRFRLGWYVIGYLVPLITFAAAVSVVTGDQG